MSKAEASKCCGDAKAIDASKFVFVQARPQEVGGPERPSFTFWKDVKLRLMKNKMALVSLAILLLLAAGVFLFYRWKTDSGYWTIAVFGVDSRDGIIESGTHSDVEMICSIVVNCEKSRMRCPPSSAPATSSRHVSSLALPPA